MQFVITDVAHFVCFSKSFLGEVALKISAKKMENMEALDHERVDFHVFCSVVLVLVVVGSYHMSSYMEILRVL